MQTKNICIHCKLKRPQILAVCVGELNSIEIRGLGLDLDVPQLRVTEVSLWSVTLSQSRE